MKRNLISFGLVLLVCVVGLGFYRGWFALSSTQPDTGSHKVNINLTVDRDKVKADAESVKEKTMELTGNSAEVVNTGGTKQLGDPPVVTK